jgi:hypothetical protein
MPPCLEIIKDMSPFQTSKGNSFWSKTFLRVFDSMAEPGIHELSFNTELNFETQARMFPKGYLNSFKTLASLFPKVRIVAVAKLGLMKRASAVSPSSGVSLDWKEIQMDGKLTTTLCRFRNHFIAAVRSRVWAEALSPAALLGSD